MAYFAWPFNGLFTLAETANALGLPGIEQVAGSQLHAQTLTQGVLARLTHRHIQSTARALWAHGMLHQARSLASAQCTPALRALTSGTPESFLPASSATVASLTALRVAQAPQEHSSRTLPSSDGTGGTRPGPSTLASTPPARSPTAASLTAHGLATDAPGAILTASFLQKQLAPTKAAQGAAHCSSLAQLSQSRAGDVGGRMPRHVDAAGPSGALWFHAAGLGCMPSMGHGPRRPLPKHSDPASPAGWLRRAAGSGRRIDMNLGAQAHGLLG